MKKQFTTAISMILHACINAIAIYFRLNELDFWEIETT